MEKEVGGGIGMVNTCKPMAVSFQCMTKSTTNKKKKKKRKKKEQIDANPKYSVLVCWQWFLTQVPWARVVDSLTLYAKCCVPMHVSKGSGEGPWLSSQGPKMA